MDIYRRIKGVIMGLIDKSKKSKVVKADLPDNLLTKAELEFLLKLIANSAFQGKDLQLIYDLTAKLQKQITG
tara:strand:- start:8328 stop:8543 length:216 start_codon:yes stop_codon:yes gene_type:complete